MRIDEICRILYRYIEHIPATNEQKLVGLVCTLVLLLVLLLANPPTWTGVTQTAHRVAMGFTLFLLGFLGYKFYRLYGTDYEPNANYFIFCFLYLGSIGVVSCGLAFCFEAIAD